MRIYGYSIRWGPMSGRLMRLEHCYQAGNLTEDQELRYRDLRREVGDVTTLTGRLGVGRPSLLLKD